MAAAFSIPLAWASSEFTISERPNYSTNAPIQIKKRDDIIDALEGYIVHRPIRITYDEIGDAEVQALFADADMAVSGISRQDAFQALTEEILAAFDDWSADESKLGPGPKQQLAVLRRYLGKGSP
jgi:hypothetical protein